jgi:hypothetical protein
VSVADGGPAAGTIATFAASLTRAEFLSVWWDGTNFKNAGKDWIST